MSIERDRGVKEARQQIPILREKWPLAFPRKHSEIRPLAVDVADTIAAALGWSLPYTLGVLANWKLAPVYCEAVLRCDQRIALDGTPAEAIDAAARDLAAKRLAQLVARKAPKSGGKGAATVPVKPKPHSRPPAEAREQLRARVRASLFSRGA